MKTHPLLLALKAKWAKATIVQKIIVLALVMLIPVLLLLQHEPSVTFAVIGDFGKDNPAELSVATMVHSWNPDFIVTTGDNNYLAHSEEEIDAAIGKYYSDYIGNYRGIYGSGSPQNRFYPAIGNHDWNKEAGYSAHLEYFALPSNERYYQVSKPGIDLFFLNSDSHEKDGHAKASKQRKWFHESVKQSVQPWKIAIAHHPPFSSCKHGSHKRMQWDFTEVDAVFSGHCHTYERYEKNGVDYFVNGLGGAGLYNFPKLRDDAIALFNEQHGAQLVTVTPQSMKIEFYSIDDYKNPIDIFITNK